MTPGGKGIARPLLGSVAGFGLAVLPVRRDRVSRTERAVFMAVNGLPDGLHPALWLVMQSGALGAVPVTAAAAAALGRPRLAARLAASGTTTYVLAKGIKSVVRRGRPGQLLPDVRVRGDEAGGPGFVSGHAGVSMSLVATLIPGTGLLLGRALRVVPALVGLGRMYVGAHLPLDVAGGAAFGRAVSVVVDYLAGSCSERPNWPKAVMERDRSGRRGAIRGPVAIRMRRSLKSTSATPARNARLGRRPAPAAVRAIVSAITCSPVSVSMTPTRRLKLSNMVEQPAEL